MTTNNSDNFLTLNSLSVERLHEDDDTYGYDYNRLADALDGFRSGVVTLIDPILTIVNQTIIPAARVFDQSVDTTYPVLIDFILPEGFVATSATISWKARNFRYIPSGSGAGTTDTDATATTPSSDSTAESGHTHNHKHTLTMSGVGAGANVLYDGISNTLTFAGAAGTETFDNNMSTNATGSSGHSHAHTHGSHSHSHNHSFSGITFTYAEGTSSRIDALLFDGTDKTSTLGGPWANDTVLINLLSLFPVGDGAWHTIQLTPHAQGRFIVEFIFGG